MKATTKQYRNFNFLIPSDLDERLKAESARSGVPMSFMVRRAIEAHLTDVEREHGKRARRRAPVH